MDPDFREPFLNGMPIDITEASFDRIVRYASGTLDGLPREQRAALLNEVLNETLNEGSLNDD